ncbi:hypothetical protein [Leeuwenhoekiella sp. H156]|uniref:hypothetical protein n=1 Tax=Leeuwenhoekiella sp. H156 TaxID=3450128 RepID=UPI003FA4AFB1
MRKLNNNKVAAFNLNEMLFTLAIIGILLLLALPKLLPLISKAKSMEAQIQLKYIYNLQTQYFYLNSKYADDFNTLDFESPRTVNENGTSNYVYEIIQSNNNQFKVRAVAITDFDRDGIMNEWEIDENGNPTQTVKD